MSTYKQNTSKVSRKIAVIAAAVLLIVVGAVLIYNHENRNAHIATQPTTAQRKAQATADLNSKRAITEAVPQTTTTTPSASSNPDTPNPTTIDLTAKTESNNSVTVIAKFMNISSGTCKLDITNGTTKFTANADVIYQPQYSSCAGFSVPTASLGHGTWNITLTVNPGATESTKTITYNVQ